ncbi:MAG TPA: glutamyl-tRNA reductase [Candidatus Acidoferrales bacterium]|nr:glutamyl-tRNA reductase [Candidatus Acidoferrales bacterium]
MNQPTILVMGINHTYAPVAIRETIDPEKIFQEIHSRWFPRLISEFFILSTCNRTEIYVVTPNSKKVEKKLESLFPEKKYYLYENNEAVKHIFYVSSGLDSMILGETEILAQIRRAYKETTQKDTVGPVLHQLCKDALRVGKHTRTTTRIGEGITSIAQAAILLAKKCLGTISDKKILLIGAGDIAERVLNSLQKHSVTDITVINRTYHRAGIVTDKYGGTPKVFTQLPLLIAQSDLVISATSSLETIISAVQIRKAMKERSTRPLCLIDLAVPRDIDENASKIASVHLYNIDAMQKLVNTNVAVRKKAVTTVEKIIQKETEQFSNWYKTRKAAPLLTELTAQSTAIKDKELARALQKLTHLNSHDKRVIATLAKRLEGKILARPIANLKKATQGTKSQDYLALAKSLFEL